MQQAAQTVKEIWYNYPSLNLKSIDSDQIKNLGQTPILFWSIIFNEPESNIGTNSEIRTCVGSKPAQQLIKTHSAVIKTQGVLITETW